MKLLRCAGRLRTLSFVFPGEKQEERSAGVGAGCAASQSGSRWACGSDRSRQQRAGGASSRIPDKLGLGGEPALRPPCSLHTAPCLRRTLGGSGAKSSRAWADSGAQREATPASPATAPSHVAAPLPCCYSPGIRQEEVASPSRLWVALGLSSAFSLYCVLASLGQKRPLGWRGMRGQAPALLRVVVWGPPARTEARARVPAWEERASRGRHPRRPGGPRARAPSIHCDSQSRAAAPRLQQNL